MNAVKDRNRQQDAHTGFTAGLEGEKISEWETVCCLWEEAVHPREDEGLVNPYAVENECESHFSSFVHFLGVNEEL